MAYRIYMTESIHAYTHNMAVDVHYKDIIKPKRNIDVDVDSLIDDVVAKAGLEVE